MNIIIFCSHKLLFQIKMQKREKLLFSKIEEVFKVQKKIVILNFIMAKMMTL